MGCSQSDELYFESGSYFGCPTIYTACTSDSTGLSEDSKMYSGCTSNDYSCITQTMHYTYPAPVPDDNQKLKVLCGQRWSQYELYRTLPTSTISSSSLTSVVSSTPSPTPSNPTASPTSPAITTSQIPNQTPAPSTPTSPGVIAGATIAGVALLLVIAFLIWFFGFHRRRPGAPADPAPVQQPWQQQSWGQPEQQQIHEVDSKGVATTYSGHQYEQVSQEPDGTWAHQNTHEVGELATERWNGR
ncbi:Nn.00g081840.m01.CDS01 [Neocucurbitaria sp. VM-36]